jgi:hypothetical protein
VTAHLGSTITTVHYYAWPAKPWFPAACCALSTSTRVSVPSLRSVYEDDTARQRFEVAPEFTCRNLEATRLISLLPIGPLGGVKFIYQWQTIPECSGVSEKKICDQILQGARIDFFKRCCGTHCYRTHTKSVAAVSTHSKYNQTDPITTK